MGGILGTARALTTDGIAALLPVQCPGCGQRGEPVCARCERTLRPPLAALPPPGVDAWCAAFAYEGVARELVARVKYRGHRCALPFLVDALAHAVQTHLDVSHRGASSAHVVTWAPTTTTRRRARGFDHARLLASGVASELGLACVPTLRRAGGPAQTGLSYHERRAGPDLRAIARVESLSVLVIDDVATTGGTLASAAGALRRAGASRVFAATLARTPPPVRYSVSAAYTAGA